MDVVKAVHWLAFIGALLGPFFGLTATLSNIMLLAGLIVAFATYNSSIDLLSLLSIMGGVLFLAALGDTLYFLKVAELMGWYVVPILILHGWKALLR